jgi:hypothetical protein
MTGLKCLYGSTLQLITSHFDTAGTVKLETARDRDGMQDQSVAQMLPACTNVNSHGSLVHDTAPMREAYAADASQGTLSDTRKAESGRPAL